MNTPLFSLLRDVPEVHVFGELLVESENGVEFETSEVRNSYPARSLLKPFQFLAADLPFDRWKEPIKDNPYCAAMGSISATPDQMEVIDNFDPKRLALTKHVAIKSINYPMDDTHRAILKSKDAPPRAEYHNCFSKHLSILEACETHGWDKEDYLSQTHPFHSKLKELLGELLGKDLKGTQWVVDGCGLPSPVMSLVDMATLFRKLGSAKPGTKLFQAQQIMLTNPNWVGGEKRVDSRLMRENPNQVIAKEGADGLLGVSILPNKKYPQGLGIVVKLYSGYQANWTPLVLDPVMEKLGLKGVGRVPGGQTIQYHFAPFEKKNSPILDISPPLSESSAVFPGDKNFKRNVTLSTDGGDHLTLSSFDTTLHIGAHTDAPNHFASKAPGIDEVDLHKYAGPCEVIEVDKRNGELIEAEDIQSVRAPRILFKTGSFPDQSSFNMDFVTLSKSLIEKLASLGVILVGIDTPSIDPSESKDLPAHHATLKSQMAILEGIDLTDIKEGCYWLSAVPLNIKGGDASPVRAVLEPLI